MAGLIVEGKHDNKYRVKVDINARIWIEDFMGSDIFNYYICRKGRLSLATKNKFQNNSSGLSEFLKIMQQFNRVTLYIY